MKCDSIHMIDLTIFKLVTQQHLVLQNGTALGFDKFVNTDLDK